MLEQTGQGLGILSIQNPVREEVLLVGRAPRTVQVFHIAYDDTVGQRR